MSWLHYLIEANIYLGVFYLCYCLFLNRDTHYTLGRVYLMFSCIIAFVLPLTLVSILKPVIPEIEIIEPIKQTVIVNHFTFNDAMIYLYITGAVIAFIVLLFRLRKLYILTRKNHFMYKDQYKLINLNDENTAFSFFNYLFIGSNVPQAETIIAHELVHIRQKHSVDIIFLEILKVINWFNPFIYLTQRSLKTVHEYIADEQTAAHEQDALTYSSFLLNNAYGIQGTSIAHSFFNYNLLKKRIIMLNKNRSGKLARLKYLAVLPLCAGMLCTSTLVFSKNYGLIDLVPRKAMDIKNGAQDTTRKKLIPPPPVPPKHKVDQIKFPPPVVKPDKPAKAPKVDQIKFPPPVVMPDKDGKMPPPPPPAIEKAPKVTVVKFARPKVVKRPPPVIKLDEPAIAPPIEKQ
jgi:hypothetical protein